MNASVAKCRQHWSVGCRSRQFQNILKRKAIQHPVLIRKDANAIAQHPCPTVAVESVHDPRPVSDAHEINRKRYRISNPRSWRDSVLRSALDVQTLILQESSRPIGGGLDHFEGRSVVFNVTTR